MTETQEQRKLTDAEIIAIVEAVDDETGFFGETKKVLNTTYIDAARVNHQVKPRILAALRASQVQTETTPALASIGVSSLDDLDAVCAFIGIQPQQRARLEVFLTLLRRDFGDAVLRSAPVLRQQEKP